MAQIPIKKLSQGKSLHLKLFSLLCGLIFLTATSCSNNIEQNTDALPSIEENQTGEDTPIDDLEVNSDESWTILVYLMGDTDLEEFAIGDVLEMASIPTSPNFNIITLFDRSETYTSESILNVPDFRDTKIFQIINGELTIL